jgi:hypothetical protein
VAGRRCHLGRLLAAGGLIVAIVAVQNILWMLLRLVRAPGSVSALELIGLVVYVGAVAAVTWGVWQLAKGNR